MRKRKIVALTMATALVLSLAACGGKSGDGNGGADGDSGSTVDLDSVEVSEDAFDEERTIKIGVYSDHYYDSTHTSIDDNPNVTDRDSAQMEFDNVKTVEKRYNCKIQYMNLTWSGIIDSINTSIMSGTPDCDIYDVALSYGLPAIINGQAQALEDFLPADDDVLTTQETMKSLNVMDMDKTYLFSVAGGVDTTAWGLCFNKDIVEKTAGLENPQDVYDRGEWTWDKFQEYMQACTYDQDGDGVTDVYGYGSYWTQTLINLMMTNGTGIAMSDKETVTAPATIEVFDFIDKMYNTWKCARPWQEDYMSNGDSWQDGTVAFWAAQHWVLNEGDIASKEWELGVVPWPVGPSGNAETNAYTNVGGDWMMIPIGIEEPAKVYEVYKDFSTWYKDDLDIVNDTSWAEDQFVTERNFNYIVEMGDSSRKQVDLWENLDADFDLVPMLTGEETATQLAERAKNVIQKKLDAYLDGSSLSDSEEPDPEETQMP